MFNQQQFDRLAEHVRLSVIVPVSWLTVVRRPNAYWNARRNANKRPYDVDYIVYWYIPGLFRSLNAVFLLVSLLLQRPRALLFDHWDCLLGSWGYPDAVATTIIGRATHTPVVAKIHGSDVNVFAQTRLRRWQIRHALNRCHSVVAVSRALAERLQAIGVESNRIQVVYNGVDDGRFCPREREGARCSLGVPISAKLVLYVGNILTSKGCDDLLSAIEILAATDDSLHLAYVGDGPQRPILESRVTRLGLAGRVRFVGKVTHDVLSGWYTAADITCLPSYNEGVPNVLLESMACGTPVVASSVGGIPEIIPEYAGILVPKGAPDSLAKAIHVALVQRSWDRSRIVAHSQNFRWDANVDAMCRIIADAVTVNHS
jgi:glycosyltransferase involved in cell wall biosynthesis